MSLSLASRFSPHPITFWPHSTSTSPASTTPNSYNASCPPWPMNSCLKRQHSVEYWMMGSLLKWLAHFFFAVLFIFEF
uniref:Uncharacterized protein n=1 Tax=Cannabis sativa TaxID=3483 RepID=A0A803R4X7_CANSA